MSRASLTRSERWTSAVALFACVALFYAAGAVLSWESFGAGITPVFFPPAGVTLAAMLLTPRSRWPVVLAAIIATELMVDLYYGVGIQVALGYALANAVEPVIGASLVLAWCKGPPDLRVRGDLAKFIAGGCVAGPLVGGMIGGAVGAASNNTSLATTVVHWWAGDAIGALVVASPILLWGKQSHLLRNRLTETVLVLAVVAVVSVLAAWFEIPPALPLLPVMAWAALRLDVIGAALAGAVVGFTFNYMTGTGIGAFRQFDLAPSAALVVTQIFVAVIVLTAMVIAQEASGRIAAVSAREAERRERDRLQILAELAQQLSAALTPSQIGEAVVRQLFNDSGAQAVAVGLVSPDERRLEWAGTAGYPETARERFGAGIPLGELTAATEALNTGRPVVIGSPSEYQRRYPDYGDLMISSEAEALVNWPLTWGDKSIGVLGLMWTRPQPFDAAQLAYISAVATMVGQALVRAQVYADEHARAAVLQAAVLPTDPVDTAAHLDVAVIYQPADVQHGLGGDWYDVMSMPKQQTYLAVGDVVGHGLPAVEDMAQLRSAGRAMALQGLPPSRILAELNTFTAHACHGRFATMAVMIVDPTTNSLSYGLAGHPFPLLRRARDGEVVQLDNAAGPALGPVRDATYVECRVTLEPGDILVLFTDGLVECRGMSIETGISRARRLVAGWQSDSKLGAGCRQLAETLASSPRQDDVCVLAVRLLPFGD